MNHTSALELENVTVDFGGHLVLKNLCLEIGSGEFVALLGPSGSGKSTLLRSIMQEVPISTGSIRRPRRIAFAPQRAPLLPWLTVLENVELAKPVGVEKYEFRQRAVRVLNRAGLGEHLELKSHKLSGGMRSRASLVRAFLMLNVSQNSTHSEVPVILLDEPFIGLDAVKRDHLHDLTNELWEETRPATIFVTHDIPEAMKLANRIVVLAKNGATFVIDRRIERRIEREKVGATKWPDTSALESEIYEALR